MAREAALHVEILGSSPRWCFAREKYFFSISDQSTSVFVSRVERGSYSEGLGMVNEGKVIPVAHAFLSLTFFMFMQI